MGGKVGLNIRSGIKAVDGTSLSPDSHAGKVGLSIGGRISGDFGSFASLESNCFRDDPDIVRFDFRAGGMLALLSERSETVEATTDPADLPAGETGR